MCALGFTRCYPLIVKEKLLIVDGEIDQKALKGVFMSMMVVNPNTGRLEAWTLNPPTHGGAWDPESNGTFVNGTQISGRQLLAENDVVKICDLEFVFHHGTPASKETIAYDDSTETGALLVDDDPDFYGYFRQATPIDVIERMQIGSRPASRLVRFGRPDQFDRHPHRGRQVSRLPAAAGRLLGCLLPDREEQVDAEEARAWFDRHFELVCQVIEGISRQPQAGQPPVHDHGPGLGEGFGQGPRQVPADDLAADDVLAIDRCGERLLLHLLAHTAGLHAGQSVGTNVGYGRDETAQFINLTGGRQGDDHKSVN